MARSRARCSRWRVPVEVEAFARTAAQLADRLEEYAARHPMIRK